MIIKCKNCNKKFSKEPHNIKRTKNHFCCRSCAATYNNKHHPKRKPEGNCKYCGKEISTSKKYCSRECRIKGQPKLTKAEKKIKDSLRHKNLRISKKIKSVKYKGGRCQICGYNKCLRALKFHHINPKEKDFNISMANNPPWEKIKKELDKCILVCGNCHDEIHSGITKI